MICPDFWWYEQGRECTFWAARAVKVVADLPHLVRIARMPLPEPNQLAPAYFRGNCVDKLNCHFRIIFAGEHAEAIGLFLGGRGLCTPGVVNRLTTIPSIEAPPGQNG